MSKQPYIPIYIGDWEQDTNTISLEAEGALIKLIFKLWKSKTKGKLEISFHQLSFLFKKPEVETRKIVLELQNNDVLTIKIEGEIVNFSSRRMLRDAYKSAIYSENGKKGGRGKKQNESKTKANEKPPLDIENNKEEYLEEKKGKRGKGKKPILDLIPKNWPTDKFLAAWSEFAEIRMKKKKPLTENAISRAISGLIELSKSDFLLAEKIILQSVDHSWDSFYPLKNSNSSANNFHHPVTGEAPPDGKGFDKRGRLWPVIGGRLIDEA